MDDDEVTHLQVFLAGLVLSGGKSQVLLAERSELSTKHVNAMLMGRCEGTLSAWQRLLDAAGVTIEQMRSGDDQSDRAGR